MWGAPPSTSTFPWGTALFSRSMAYCFRSAMAARSRFMVARPAVTAAARAASCPVASVPERRPFSCPPPRMKGEIFRPFRIYMAPMPLGAWILWPLMLSMSTPSSFGVKGTFKKPCTPSQWSSAPLPASFSTRAVSATGRMVPSSLFTSIMDTRMVSGRRASFTCWAVMFPLRSGWR